MEEHRRSDPRGLGTQELAPGGSVTSGSGAEAVVLYDPGNGACRKTYSELAQFSLDAPVAPPRVLLCQAHDECGRLVFDGRTTW